MGNPNVFGLFLLLAAVYFYVIERKFYIPIILAVSTFATGSLVSMLIGCCALLCFLLKAKKYFPPVFLAAMTILIFRDINISPVAHILGKIDALSAFIFFGDSGDSLSISARINYYLDGFNLLIQFPTAIFFGHPDGILFYSGDGLYIYYLVSFGLILFSWFVISNLILFKNAINSINQLNKFLGIVLGIYLTYFFTNRILDYWPAAFPYLLAVVFLSKNER
jgi:hypothetical protein